MIYPCAHTHPGSPPPKKKKRTRRLGWPKWPDRNADPVRTELLTPGSQCVR
jgi:hypothetical protein